eukprot:6125863-Alexandrium_andersonii.AAC.1
MPTASAVAGPAHGQGRQGEGHLQPGAPRPRGPGQGAHPRRGPSPPGHPGAPHSPKSGGQRSG